MSNKIQQTPKNMKRFASKLAASLGFVALTASANAATTYNEGFETTTAGSVPTGWTATGDATVATDSIIARSGSNYLTMGTRNSNSATTQSLSLSGATEATISFYWTTTGTYGSAFGRVPQIEYSSDGINFAQIGTVSVPSSNSGTRPYTFFSQTIDTSTNGGTSFTANSKFRFVGDNDSGGGGAPFIMDDLSITSNAVIPEPSAALLGGIGALLLLRRRR